MKIFISLSQSGSVKSAAGLLVRADSTGNYLWTQRSRYVNNPYQWSLTVGGQLEEGEDPLDAARREFYEELSYHGHIKINETPVYSYKDNDFTYTAFLASVPGEFELSPFVKWRFEEIGNWEMEDYEWRPINDPPNGELHFGTAYILKSFRDFNRQE